MAHTSFRYTQKAALVPVFFLFTLFGHATLPTLFPAPAVAFAAVESPKPIYNNLPVARNVPVIPVKKAAKPVSHTAAIMIPKAAPKKQKARLSIPSIKVNAVIKDMGVTSEGVMAIPNNTVDVGWFRLGTRPGETGSAVIGAHNRWGNSAGVFDHLDRLKKGDVMSVVDAKGASTSFVVRETRTYAATDFDNDIFLSASGVHLNLITCSGVWDPVTKSYTTRLVVFTDEIITEQS